MYDLRRMERPGERRRQDLGVITAQRIIAAQPRTATCDRAEARTMRGAGCARPRRRDEQRAQESDELLHGNLLSWFQILPQWPSIRVGVSGILA
jgi:hypothetical protein